MQDERDGPAPQSHAAADGADSDCEIQETHISVIELNDSMDETEAGVAHEEQPNHHDNELPDNGTLFTVTFSDREKFSCLHAFLTEAIKKCLDERSVCIEMVVDEEKRSLRAVEKMELENITDLIFSIDTTPAARPEIGAIPSYKRSIRDVFDDEKKKEVDEDECPKRMRMSNVCFNCSGSHSLKDCTEPKNQQRINKARKMFTTKQERYHVDIEQRFAHLKPGRITTGLRKAMGLRSREIPPFIYRMRVLGYPPGWLEDAKVAHSGLAMFDSEGRQVQESDEGEGVLEEPKHKYDVRKIISFPGFNCEPEPDLIEDRQMPPMHPEDQKEVFIKSLGENIEKGYKRKKMKNLVAIADPEKQETNIVTDMEIEDAEPMPQYLILTAPLPPPLPDVSLPPLPPGTPPVSNTAPGARIHRKSPTLEDLEAKQRQLMEALENSTSVLDATAEDSLIDEILEVEKMNEEERTTNRADIQTANISTVSNGTTSADRPSTPLQNNATNMKSSVLGTPVLKFSPYDKLPTGDQFSVGVSDVINFENLPDSTGKYEKMTLVIEKVRKAVIKSNEEN